MDLGLRGKVALVTGTASEIGMGKGIAETLAKEGCKVVSADMDLAGAQKTSDNIKAAGGQAIAVKVDLVNEAEVNDLVKKAVAEYGSIDILVNSAGLVAKTGPFMQTEPADWKKDTEVNFYGSMYLAKAIAPIMMERKYGKMVMFSSGVARSGGGSYASSKGAVLTLTKGLASELGPSGIYVNGIAPGMAPTNFGGGFTSQRSKAMEMVAQRMPLRRITTVEDIVGAVVFLVSRLSDGVTGETISVGPVGP